ncbi:MAG: ATP-binding cassette domain-containing protein, partial [Bacteroidetes bacterium]|nr:ATP-binding cassette domain-containing protein [Bacteroidota bacterium]
TYVSKLSGGERRRLYLLTVLMKNANFLRLDEPTKDLDLLTLNKLEEFLLQFKCCLILVSHDRYFMDKLTDHLFVFQGDGVIEDHYCSYTEFREKQLEAEKESKKVKETTVVETDKKEVSSSGKKKFSFKEKYEYDTLEKEIEILEKEKTTLENQLTDPNIDFETITEVSERLGIVIESLDEKSFRWMELDELA